MLFLWKLGYLKGPTARPQLTQQAGPTATPPGVAAAAPTQHVVLHHELSAAPIKPAADGPVHETQVIVPMKILVVPQPPAAVPPA